MRALSTTLALKQHHSVDKLMQAATWRSTVTFAQFYLRDTPSSLDGISQLGPIVAAQAVVGFEDK